MELLSDQDVAGRPRRATGWLGRLRAARGGWERRGAAGSGARRRGAPSGLGLRRHGAAKAAVTAGGGGGGAELGSGTRTNQAARDGWRPVTRRRGGRRRAGLRAWTGDRDAAIGRSGQRPPGGTVRLPSALRAGDGEPRAPATRMAQRPEASIRCRAARGAGTQDGSLGRSIGGALAWYLAGPSGRTSERRRNLPATW